MKEITDLIVMFWQACFVIAASLGIGLVFRRVFTTPRSKAKLLPCFRCQATHDPRVAPHACMALSQAPKDDCEQELKNRYLL